LKNDDIKNAVYTALDYSGYFPDGIYTNGRALLAEQDPETNYWESSVDDTHAYMPDDVAAGDSFIDIDGVSERTI
jgi:hypothetical protein